MAQDELCAFGWACERQPHYLVAKVTVGLHDGVLGAFGFFDGLAALRVGGVDGRPIGREKDRVAISTWSRLLSQICRERVTDEVGAGEGVANATIEVDGAARLRRGLRVPGRNRPLHQELCEARGIRPRKCAATACHLFLNEGAGIFGDADVAATGELGEHGGLAGARAAGALAPNEVCQKRRNCGHAPKRDRCDVPEPGDELRIISA